MNLIKSYLFILRFFISGFLIVSCETAPKSLEPLPESTNTTIRLNFQDNIQEVNPLRVNNPTEQFVVDLVFDRFLNEDESSDLFQNLFYDSLNQTYVFELQTNKTFHDGSQVNSESIRMFFKYLLKHEFDNKAVFSLFSSIEGFSLVNWYRENRNINDSIPSGFQIVNNSKFSLKMRQNGEDISQLFKDQVFTLFKIKDNSYMGSGSYKLVELNEDISAKLINTKTREQGIETILISFTKNIDLVYSEFFRGSLDLVSYNPYTIETKHKSSLDKILKNKYAQYQTSTTNLSVIKYMKVQMQDSALLKSVLGEIHNIENKSVYSSVNLSYSDTLEHTTLDTIKYDIRYLEKDTNEVSFYFKNDNSLNFIISEIENLNPNEPQIVIKEINREFVDVNDEKSFENLFGKQSKISILEAYVILDVFQEYVIFSNHLKGIKPGNSISEIVEEAYFENVKSY